MALQTQRLLCVSAVSGDIRPMALQTQRLLCLAPNPLYGRRQRCVGRQSRRSSVGCLNREVRGVPRSAVLGGLLLSGERAPGRSARPGTRPRRRARARSGRTRVGRGSGCATLAPTACTSTPRRRRRSTARSRRPRRLTLAERDNRIEFRLLEPRLARPRERRAARRRSRPSGRKARRLRGAERGWHSAAARDQSTRRRSSILRHEDT